MFALLITAVSAATVIYNRTRYVPGVGFTDRDYTVYAIPEIIELGGGAVIETIMRVHDAETGESEFVMIITSRTYGERDNDPDFQKFEQLTVTAPDGTEYTLVPRGTGVSSRTLVPGELDGTYVYDGNLNFTSSDFPEINEFVISDANGRFLAAVTLVEGAFQGLYGYTEENGVMIVVRQVAKNSRVIVYKVDDRNFDLDYLFGEGHPFVGRTGFLPISIYDANGNNLNIMMQNGANQLYYDSIALLDERPEKIGKATAMGVIFEVRDVWGHWSDGGYSHVLADIDIPVPADGEKIEYAEPLVIYSQNGITVMINSIERNGDNIIIKNYQYDIYEGPNADRIKAFEANFMNSDMYWRRTTTGGGPDAWFGEGTYERETIVPLSEENMASQTVRLYLSRFAFVTLYDWEISFGEHGE